MTGDDAMTRRLFIEMPAQEQEAFVAALQARRLQLVNSYKEIQDAKRLAKNERVRAMIEDQCRIMDKDIATMDKAMDRIATRMTKIIALGAIMEGSE